MARPAPAARAYHLLFMRPLVLALLAVATPATAEAPQAAFLDSLIGDWELLDPTGAKVGQSRVVVQAPGAMLYEERRIGSGAIQPLWFANSEPNGGWTQLFVGVSGQIREFRMQSPAGEWPLVLGADVRLADGSPARFRLTVTPLADGNSRRVLERSTDVGANWTTVFNYTYRKTQP
jgi:hypothetical protein